MPWRTSITEATPDTTSTDLPETTHDLGSDPEPVA